MPPTKPTTQDRLIEIIEGDHQVISANTASNSRLIGVLEQMQDTQKQMQNAIQALVTQVTTSLCQQQTGVPVKIFLIVVGVMALIIAVVLGVDISGYKIGV